MTESIRVDERDGIEYIELEGLYSPTTSFTSSIVKGGLVMGWSCPHEVKWFCQRLRKECRPGQRGCVLQDKVTYFDPDEALAHWSKRATCQAASDTDEEALSADKQLPVPPGGDKSNNSSSR